MINPSTQQFEVGVSNSQRLDTWLALHGGRSRSFFAGLIEQGAVLVNGQKALKRHIVVSGDTIEVHIPKQPASPWSPECLPLTILYEDAAIMVIDKSAGIVVHPGAGATAGTLANALAYHLQDANTPSNELPLRAGLVHRIDKDTSGLLVVAKTAHAHAHLCAQFASRAVDKHYLAIACRDLPPAKVEQAIGRDKINRQKMTLRPDGRPATTFFYPLLSSIASKPLHLIHVIPQSGRTHQIRIHLAAHQAPILGDSVYGWQAWNQYYDAARQMLHAWQLGFHHPLTGNWMCWLTPPPADFMAQLTAMHPPAALLEDLLEGGEVRRDGGFTRVKPSSGKA